MNIIFLDVDGVLNSLAYFESIIYDEHKKLDFTDISEYHLSMLAQLYHKAKAKIVLSSTWRSLDDPSDNSVYPMYQYLINSLNRYNMEIIDKTPCIGNKRPLEILTWVQNNMSMEHVNFVSLDDDFSTEQYKRYGIGYCLVQTKYFCRTIEEGGLHQRHVDLALRKLKLQENKRKI